MDLSGNTVLITGGATGIGLRMAETFAREGSRVLICGRREAKLEQARQALPEVEALRCDVADAADRERLAVWAEANGVNILVNNAGMQRMVDLSRGLEALEQGDNEVRCNLEGPIYLTARLVPHLRSMSGAAVVNVSSGLGFVPMARMPVYCATKAALHAFTVSLRHQLAAVGVRVFELIPPMVDTDLDRGARAERGQADRGIRPEEVVEAMMAGLAEDRPEIPVGRAFDLIDRSRADFDAAFAAMNARR